MNFSATRASLRAAWSHAFSRPRVLACTSLSEVVPLDVMLLRVQVEGWGWLDIRGPQGFSRREFFREPGTLEVTVPVRAALTLKVMNPWGSRSYPIDTNDLREEVWRAPEAAYEVRLPDGLQPAYDRFGAPRDARVPHVALPSWLAPPSLATRVAGPDVRGMPSTRETPALVVRPLPVIGQAEAAPAQARLPAWQPQLPMATLESRMAHARIEP